MPSVLRPTSTPTSAPRSQRPALTPPSARPTLRAVASSRATVCSAALRMLPEGELTTTMPRPVAAGTSMLSTPTPARATTLSLRPARSTAAVTAVSDRTMRPW